MGVPARSVYVEGTLEFEFVLASFPQNIESLHRYCQRKSQESLCFRPGVRQSSPELSQRCPESGSGGTFRRSTAKAVGLSATDIDHEGVQDVHRTALTIHRLTKQARHKISACVHSSTMASQCSALIAVLRFSQMPRCTIGSPSRPPVVGNNLG